jgi:hypothetical protein
LDRNDGLQRLIVLFEQALEQSGIYIIELNGKGIEEHFAFQVSKEGVEFLGEWLFGLGGFFLGTFFIWHQQQ